MSHLRQQIREEIATTLTGLTTTGDNVFMSRVYPMEQAKLPGIIIYTVSEQTSVLTIGEMRTMESMLTVAVEVYAMGANIDDSLDEVCLESQIALANNRTLSSLAKDIQLDSTQITFAQESEAPAGYATMNWSVFYQFIENNPEVAV
jgi:hypothetical protein